jgi:hypothetical protein
LRKAGYSEEQIAIIQEEVPDLDVVIMKESGLSDSRTELLEGLTLRNETGSAVVFKFNGFLVTISKTDTGDDVVEKPTEIEALIEDSARESREKDRSPAASYDVEKKINDTYNQLPDFFKEWVKHESNRGDFCSSRRFFTKIAIDANQLVEELKSVEELERWKKLSLEKQEEAVPGLVADHSIPFIHNKVLELAKEYLSTINN